MNSHRVVDCRKLAALFVAGAVLVTLAPLGCGNQDQATAPLGSQNIVFVPAPTTLNPLDDRSNGNSGSGWTEQFIIASQGGVVTAGRHTVIIPPGALYQDTTITVEDSSDDGIVGCELQPHGILFRNPVTLVTCFSDLADPAGYTMFWDSTSPTGVDVWMNVGGEVTPDSSGIQVQLGHFSRYAPGKAGW